MELNMEPHHHINNMEVHNMAINMEPHHHITNKDHPELSMVILHIIILMVNLNNTVVTIRINNNKDILTHHHPDKVMSYMI